MAKILKACKYCGGIHPIGFNCPRKPDSSYTRNPKIRAFRNSALWKRKSKEIKERDHYLCQACLNNLPGTIHRINSVGLSVHHIKSLVKAWALRLCSSNLITLCTHHHELAEKGEIPEYVLQSIAKNQEISPPEGQ